MVLVKKETKRLEIPHEPGEWVDVRVPLSAGDLAGLETDGSGVAISLGLMSTIVEAWSYPQPVTRATLDLLDLDTMGWLSKEIYAASGIKDADEKKGSGSSSPAITEPAPESSQMTSAT